MASSNGYDAQGTGMTGPADATVAAPAAKEDAAVTSAGFSNRSQQLPPSVRYGNNAAEAAATTATGGVGASALPLSNSIFSSSTSQTGHQDDTTHATYEFIGDVDASLVKAEEGAAVVAVAAKEKSPQQSPETGNGEEHLQPEKVAATGIIKEEKPVVLPGTPDPNDRRRKKNRYLLLLLLLLLAAAGITLGVLFGRKSEDSSGSEHNDAISAIGAGEDNENKTYVPSTTPPPTNTTSRTPTTGPIKHVTDSPTEITGALPSKSTLSPAESSVAQSIYSPIAEPTAEPTPAPTSDPTEAPTKEPISYSACFPTLSPSPTQAPNNVPLSKPPTSNPPTDAPTTNMLQVVGDNGTPAEAFPLKKCQGDCDQDNNCEGDLLCYYGSVGVPGCEGSGTSGKEYCAERPSPTYLFLRRKNKPLGPCEGDCTSDDDCEDNLTCVGPDSDMQVDGCDGQGVDGAQYCQLPSLTETGDLRQLRVGLCEGECNNHDDCQGDLHCFLRVGTEAVPGCVGAGISGAGYCTSRQSNNYLWIQGGLEGSPLEAFPLGLCEGDCDSDSDCEGDLICEKRRGDSDEEVPGCDGQGGTGIDYCRYSLTYFGSDPSELYPLGKCEGDCDSDDECRDGLLCYFRSTDNEVVPGCSGGRPRTDYCTERETPTTLFLRGFDNDTILGLCEGDCQNDNDCEGSLVCFQRDGTEGVPGCDDLGASGKDYCYDLQLCYDRLSGSDSELI